MNNDKIIKLSDILDYSYCDDNFRSITKLNVTKLKELFNTDEIILEETYHR